MAEDPDKDSGLVEKTINTLINAVYSDTSKRMTMQGSAELANALFNGSAYVPYGQGQFMKSEQRGQESGGVNQSHQEQAGHDQQQPNQSDGKEQGAEQQQQNDGLEM